MARSYSIGMECYALLTSSLDAEMLLPVKIIILEKHTWHSRTTYKVRIKEILENDFKLLKEMMNTFRVSTNLKSENRTMLIKKVDLDKIETMDELNKAMMATDFYLEDNYITLDKEGLKDLYIRFVKYLINYHYQRLYQLTSRHFLAGTGFFENQKDVFKKRIEHIGFDDYFKKNKINLDL